MFTAPSRAYWFLGYGGWQFITLGILLEAVLIFIVNGLMERFPEETAVGIYRKVFGRFAGTVLALALAGWFIITGAGGSWLMARGVKIALLTDTPIEAIFALGGATVVYAAMYGIVRLARFTEISVPVLVPLLAIIMIIPWQNIDLGNLMPIFTFDVKAYANPSLWFSIFMFRMHALLLILRPRLINPPRARALAFFALAVSGIFFYVTFAYPVAIFGMPVAKQLIWPFWASIRIVRFSGFPLEKLLYFAVVTWHFVSLITSSLLLYGAVGIFEEVLSIRQDKFTTLGVALIYFILVLRIANYKHLMAWDALDMAVGWVVTAVTPALALILAKVRGLGRS